MQAIGKAHMKRMHNTYSFQLLPVCLLCLDRCSDTESVNLQYMRVIPTEHFSNQESIGEISIAIYKPQNIFQR